MKKEQAVQLTNLKLNLTLTLIDDLFYEIWECRARGDEYQQIAKKMKINWWWLSRLINAEPHFIEGLQNKTLANRLNNLKSN